MAISRFEFPAIQTKAIVSPIPRRQILFIAPGDTAVGLINLC